LNSRKESPVKEKPEAKQEASQTPAEIPKINRLEALKQAVKNPQTPRMKLIVQAIKETPGLENCLD